MTIITNGHHRDLLSWRELTDDEKDDFDWIDNPDDRGQDFFRYRGDAYCLDQFERTVIGGWDGYHGDTFFSGILIRYPVEDWGDYITDAIVVGLYLN